MNTLTLSSDHVTQMRRQLKESRDLKEYQRIVALLAVNEGRPVSEVARMLGVTRQSIYYWFENCIRSRPVLDFKDAPRTGRPSLMTSDAQSLVENLLRQLPRDFGYTESHWTIPRLQEHLSAHSAHKMSNDTLRRLLLRLGYSWNRRQLVWERVTSVNPPAAPQAGFEGAVIAGADKDVKRLFSDDATACAAT